MRWLFMGFAHSLMVSAAPAAYVAYLVWRRRGRAGASYLAGVMLAIALWAYAAGAEVLATSTAAKILWSKVAYFGELGSSTLLLLFTLEFCGFDIPSNRRRWLWLPAVLVIALAWTNEWHGLIWSSFSAGLAGTNILIYHHGPMWWAKVIWEYAEIAACAVLLLHKTIHSRGVFRRQTFMILLALSVSLPGGWLYVFLPASLDGLDATPLTFCLSGLLVALALFKTRLFDLVPIAYEAVFEHVGEAIVVTDAGGRIIDFNAAAGRMLDIGHNVIGASADACLAAAVGLSPAAFCAVQAHPDPIECSPAQHPDLTTELRVYPVAHAAAAAAGQLIVLVDVTARKRAELALQELNTGLEAQVAARTADLQATAEQLRELDRLKNAFLANVSHELRTPLSNIKLYASLLREGKPEKRQKYLDTVDQQVALLQRLVEQLLNVSQVQGEARPLHLTPLDAPALLELTRQRYDEQARRGGLVMHWTCEEGLPLVSADTRALAEAIDIVLDNAVNYTPAGGRVVVQVSPAEHDAAAGVAITVTDSGSGITAVDLPHVFDRFYRGRASLELGVPGLGMGLFSARARIERMGGQVTVDSRPGAGSAFTIWLPAAESVVYPAARDAGSQMVEFADQKSLLDHALLQNHIGI
jgi:signal transduction histidine kinase/PAS domain-containing protein